MLQATISQSASSITTEELRQIALLMHQLHVLDLEKSLWDTYLKSGIGSFKADQSHIKIWPSEVKAMIRFARRSTTISDINQINILDDHCYQFVNNQLREFNEKQQQLRQQLIRKKKQFYHYRDPMDQILQTLVQEQMQSLRLEYEYKIKLVEFDYRQEVLDQAVQQQHPNVQQVNNDSSYLILLTIYIYI